MTLMLHKPLVSNGFHFALSFSTSFSNPAFPYVSFTKTHSCKNTAFPCFKITTFLCRLNAPNIVLLQLLLSSDFLN